MRKLNILFLLIVLLPLLSLYSQNASDVKPSDFKLEENIPTDPNVLKGIFDNGFTYYIKENKKPENRASLWLAVNAGAVLENDDQRGLAHFVEHMGFNGTKNFKKHELIDYLESIGMKFGPEINAYTSFDETVYFIQVPTDSAYYVETGFQILEDWAHNVSFEEEEIDRERGVVGEEWRLGRGAGMRMLDKQLPILFKDSRYAERLTIGKKEIIDTCSYETLISYYKDWYRPDLMAIVAVGDFNKDDVFNLIKKHFATIPVKENPRERILYPVPDHDETLFAIASDKEADRTQIGLYFKSKSEPKEVVGDFRRLLMSSLYNSMLNNRLSELTKKAAPPYLYGYSGQGQFVRTKGVYFLGAGVKEGGIKRGIETLLTEAARVKKFGFTETEFDRAKIEMMRSLERSYIEDDKTESNRFAQSFVSNYLNDNPIPSAEQELAMGKQLLPLIKLDEVNALVNKWITEKNRVVLISSPEKESIEIPSEGELLKLIEETSQKEVEPYEDNVSSAPLVENIPEPTPIIEESINEKLGITQLKLVNGINVILKPTDFKNDEVIFNSYSHGGNSLISDDDIVSAYTSTSIIQESGIGVFNNIELKKKLTGKVVNVRPYISEHYEGIRGNASPDDLEEMFKLIYLYITSPREDNEAYQSYLTRMKGFIENRNVKPETAFQDTIQVTLSQYHKRNRPWSTDLLNEINHQVVMDFYNNRFADVGDFNFFFVGNFDVEKIKPLIQTYLGNLPNIKREESWKDTKVEYPKGVIKKEVYRGIEEKSQVRVSFTGGFETGYKNNYKISSLVDVMQIKLREVLREDLGGTYGVGIWQSSSIYPEPEYSLNITFGCNPERVEEMIDTLFIQLDSLKNYGTSDANITKVREKQTRNYELNLKKNGFWLNNFFKKHFYGEDLEDILHYPNHVKELSNEMIIEAANKYFDLNNYVQVILYPEKMKQ